MNISVVIPLLNEEESIKELHDWIVAVMQSNRFLYEILFIDDGSTDASWEVIQELAAQNPNVKGIRFLKNFGKSQALHAGFKEVQGEVVVTMDADLQDNPEEIPELYQLIKGEGYDLVSGWNGSILFSAKTSHQNYSTGLPGGPRVSDCTILTAA